MRAIQDRDLAKIDIFVAQLENSLRDKLRLLAAIIQRDHSRFHRV